MHRCFVVMLVPDRFVPYGPEYDEAVYFFNRDDGYSRTMYFRHRFLFGCRYYRRFWVCHCYLKHLVTADCCMFLPIKNFTSYETVFVVVYMFILVNYYAQLTSVFPDLLLGRSGLQI